MTVMSRPVAKKSVAKGEYIETVSAPDEASRLISGARSLQRHCRFAMVLEFSDWAHLLSHYTASHTLCFYSSSLTFFKDSGNKVSRRSAITGTANITLGGRTVIMADVVLRGDLHSTRSTASSSGKEGTPTSISIGKCTVVSTGTVLKPPCRMSRGAPNFYPMKIGDNVFIGMLPPPFPNRTHRNAPERS